MPAKKKARPAAPPPRHRLLAPLAIALGSGLLFWLSTRGATFLDIDSGPYLSMAHHLLTAGAPVSTFNFVGNFSTLPSAPNFAPPGLPFLLSLCRPLAGDWVGAGRILLALCLFAAQLSTYLFLARALGDRAYALGISFLLVWHPDFAVWASLLLTELPFLACLLAALAAGLAVLGRGAPGRARLPWLPLTLASALLPLVRYLGVFFPPAFSAVFLARSGKGWRKALLPLAAYNALAFLPLALWLAAVRAGGSPLTPERPASRLSLPAALGDAGGYLLAWVGPWALVGGLFWLLLRWRRRDGEGRQPRPGQGPTAAELLTGASFAGYLALLFVLRTRSAYYPVEELGLRYAAPLWPLALLLAALLGHRLVWVRRGRLVTALGAAAALAAVVLWGRALAERDFPPLFPNATATYRAALDLSAPRDGILTNFGQAFVADRPEAKVVGIPSQLDFRYELDVPALSRQHGLRWLVLFAIPGGEELYGDWYGRWLAAPPREFPVRGVWRTADGVIFQLQP